MWNPHEFDKTEVFTWPQAEWDARGFEWFMRRRLVEYPDAWRVLPGFHPRQLGLDGPPAGPTATQTGHNKRKICELGTGVAPARFTVVSHSHSPLPAHHCA